MASTSAITTNSVKEQKGSYHRCSFIGCGLTQRKNPHLHFFRFPTSRPNVLEQWLVNCGNEDLIALSDKTLHSRKVCEKHFTIESFTNLTKKYLKKDAVPTLLCIANDEQQELHDPAPQELSLPSIENNPIVSQQSPSIDTQIQPQKSPSPASPTTPKTPQYKRFKSVQNRTPTPRKQFLTPVKRRLLLKLKSSEKKTKKFQARVRRMKTKKQTLSKQVIISSLEELLPPAVSKFVSMQLNHVSSKKKQWSEEERKIALSMSYISPRFYEHMRTNGFALPSKSTIARWLSEVDLKPGICQDLVKTMKAKVECMTEWEKKSVILFDEMQIKTSLEYDSKRDVVEGLRDLGELGRSRIPGTKIMLFMARGLLHKWKMPLAYFVVDDTITSESVAQIVNTCVSTMIDIGLDVKGVVCDQSSTNRGAARMMGVTLRKPFFHCKQKTIIWIYDFPHVIKCVRNNLMKKNKQGHNVGSIVTDTGVADWSHVAKLYELDKLSSTARATKLTAKHINPNAFEKMSVKLATQVFSHTVSSAMMTAVATSQLPPEAEQTAAFLDRLNDIFDSMNSHTQFHSNPRKCAISNSKNRRLEMPMKTIKEGIEWVKTWNMKDVKTRPPSFLGMEHSLKAVLLLWDDLQREGVSYLLTARINQDALENEFSIARQRGGYNRNPTVRLFRQNLRHRIKCAMLQPSTGSNCEPDEDGLLEVDHDLASSSLTQPSTSAGPSRPTSSSVNVGDIINDGDISYDDSEISDGKAIYSLSSAITDNQLSLEACSVRYFAGYGVCTCMQKVKCRTCLTEMTVKPASTCPRPGEELIANRQYASASGKPGDFLISPADETVDVTTRILQVFDKLFLKNISGVGIRKKIDMKCRQVIFKEFNMWMKCGTDCYTHRLMFVNKIISVKLLWKLQEISKDIRQPGGKHGAYRQKVNILEGK